MSVSRRNFMRGVAGAVVTLISLPGSLTALASPPRRVARLVVRRDPDARYGMLPTTCYLFHFSTTPRCSFYAGEHKFYGVQYSDAAFTPERARAHAIEQFRAVLDRNGYRRIWPIEGSGERIEI